MRVFYSVAGRFQGGGGNERVIGFHGNITRVPAYIGLLKYIPHLFTVVPEK